ncbi:hypothetical protein R2A130_0850 [Ahrensia sp. R2A130]|nr:hypothetical protein R2A130_0850 [Ahrensia sp. R2A130]
MIVGYPNAPCALCHSHAAMLAVLLNVQRGWIGFLRNHLQAAAFNRP